jgi:hypothetical protein
MADSPTLNYLLGQMAQDKEVLNGWDAVLNVIESAANAFFAAQYQAMTSNSGQMSISQVFCGPPLSSPHGQYCVVTYFLFTLGPPAFVFTGGSNTVTVTQPILSGVTRSGTLSVDGGFQPASCGCVPNDPRVEWGPTQEIDVGTQPTVTAAVPLTSVTGLINAQTHTILLDFANGAFTVGNLVIQGVSSQQLADQIRSWFATNPVQYQLASFDTAAGGSIPSLTPTQLQLHVFQTNFGNMIVQVLITTDGTPASGFPLVVEPVPTADGYTCTLMVNSRIVFTDLLCGGFNAAGKPFQLHPQLPSASEGYSAYIAPEMNFSGSFSYGDCCDRTTVTYNIYLGGTYTGTATSGFYLYQSITPSGNVQDTITVSASNPVNLTGSAETQSIQIQPQTPSVTVTGGASDRINSELQSILSTDFQAAMAGISFSSLTYFALKNVLFPGNLIAMKVVQVPTDLVIVGNFQPTS